MRSGIAHPHASLWVQEQCQSSLDATISCNSDMVALVRRVHQPRSKSDSAQEAERLSQKCNVQGTGNCGDHCRDERFLRWTRPSVTWCMCRTATDPPGPQCCSLPQRSPAGSKALIWSQRHEIRSEPVKRYTPSPHHRVSTIPALHTRINNLIAQACLMLPQMLDW